MGLLSAEYKAMLLKMKPDDITAKFIDDYLTDKCKVIDKKFKEIPSKIKTYDEFTLNPGEYFNKEKITTNVGLFIYNKFLIEESFSDIVGYVNTPVTSKVYASVESKLSDALLNDVITTEEFVKYINKLQWLAMQFNTVFSNSFTMKTLKPLPKVMKEKERLIKENEKDLKAGNITNAAKIEKQLIDLAKEELKGDPGLTLYESGARGKFENNYKNNSIIKGPVKNPTTNTWDFVPTNFMDGIAKEDIPSYGNSVVTGVYPKAVGTQIGGYMSKQLTAAFQGLVIDKPDTDCGTDRYLEITITENIKKDILYRYILDGNKLVLLDNTNFNKYVNKTVKMRSAMFCIGDKICSKCAGTMFYKLGIKNIGLTTSKMGTTLVNLGMKSFHDSTVTVKKLDINKLTI